MSLARKVLLLLLVGGCMPPAPSSTTSAETAAESEQAGAAEGVPEGGFPISLVVGPGAGPSLYRGAHRDDPAIGYVSPGVAVEVTGPIENGRVPVRIRGGLKVRGYLVAQRLYARVQRRGRIRGTPIYVGGNDLVRVVGFEQDGRVRVSVRAGSTTDPLGEAYVGTYPVAGLGSAVVGSSETTDPPGTPCTLAGSGGVEVRETVDGAVIGTFPAGTPCRNVRPEGDGFAVLVGSGPYVQGFVRSAPLASSGVTQPLPTTTASSGLPSRLRADSQHELVRIAAGTRVRFDETTIALLDVEGRARVLERYSDTNEADVFVAVDDGVAVRGMVPLDAIQAVGP